MAVADIKDDIVAYEAMQQDLETHSVSKWVLIHDRKLVAIFDSFESAAESAVAQFGRGPYLIRQVGGSPVVLPTSVMLRPEYGTR
jgi:predicted LPLAT superfamily acyltransferase